MYWEAETSATANSLPPTMRSKTSRPDLRVMQLRSTPSTATSPSRIASSRSYRQLAKGTGRRDAGGVSMTGLQQFQEKACPRDGRGGIPRSLRKCDIAKMHKLAPPK